MKYTTKLKTLKGFTLIELIIVIMIISLVGVLIFSEVSKKSKKAEKLTPLNLSSTLRKAFGLNAELEFLCINDNQKCYTLQKNGNIEEYKGNIDLGGEDLKVFVVDKDNRVVQIDEFGRIKDNKISLRYKLYKNGANQKIILSNNKGVYYIPTYFGKPQRVEDIDEAKELWIKPEYNLRDKGDYY